MGQQQSASFRALLISPTYANSSSRLPGTVNDAHAWYKVLVDDARIDPKCVTWLSDSTQFPQITDKANAHQIVRELQALVAWAKTVEKPVIFIAYSGHGTRQKDDNGDEEDGYDEGWVSNDLAFVRDDYLNQMFLAKLPKDCRVVAVNDACHNGTVWDTD